MSEHPSVYRVDLNWQRQGSFSHEGFERRHEVDFGNQLVAAVGGAGNEFGADPEKLLAASLASCHMQTFLALAAKKRLQVVSYEDCAEAVLTQREDGRFHVSTIRLSPLAVFDGEKIPDAEAIEAMHHKAHDHCFIANSVTCAIEVSPRLG